MYSFLCMLMVLSSVLVVICVLPTARDIPALAGALAMAAMSCAMIDLAQTQWDILASPAWGAILILCAPILTLVGRLKPALESPFSGDDLIGLHRSFSMIAMGAILIMMSSACSTPSQATHGHTSGAGSGATILICSAYAFFSAVIMAKCATTRTSAKTLLMCEATFSVVTVTSMGMMNVGGLA
ncbi:hypothetical protein FBY31_4523 [Arthrobacter sp. SLBN-100]|nr:hypothetical protein FBY31_4523 [Arthrobacter sp. SLBN-100]